MAWWGGEVRIGWKKKDVNFFVWWKHLSEKWSTIFDDDNDLNIASVDGEYLMMETTSEENQGM